MRNPVKSRALIVSCAVVTLVAVSVATELGSAVSAFEIIPNLFYPYMLLLSSLVFVFLVPEKKK